MTATSCLSLLLTSVANYVLNDIIGFTIGSILMASPSCQSPLTILLPIVAYP